MCVVHEDQSTSHEPSVRNLLPNDRLQEVHRSVRLQQGQPPGYESEGGEHVPETFYSSRDSLLLCGRSDQQENSINGQHLDAATPVPSGGLYV